MKREFSRSRSLNEIVTFVSGFCFLQFELLLGRILSPFFGSSTVTWSYLIASVLVGFALGTWSAGQSVDQLQPEQLQKKVSNHFFLLSILFLSYAFAIVPILTFVTDYFGFNEVTSIFSH